MQQRLGGVRKVDLRVRAARPDRAEGGVGAGHDPRVERPGAAPLVLAFRMLWINTLLCIYIYTYAAHAEVPSALVNVCITLNAPNPHYINLNASL